MSKLELQNLARRMREELESNWLEVVLVPSRDLECAMRGGRIRAVQSQNALWYREFCARYHSSRRRMRRRKIDTAIKRQGTIKALRQIERGRNGTKYTERITVFAGVARELLDQ